MTHPQDDETLLDLEEDASSTEQLENQVHKAQEQLLQLRRQQETIERQKRELEELNRRQHELEEGQAEMTETLNRALVVLERETYEAQKRVEQLTVTRSAFLQHLDVLERIDPRHWDKASLGKELSRALSAVEDARTEYAKSRSKINAEGSRDLLDAEDEEGSVYAGEEKGFVYWLKSGFAFTLPIFVLGLILLWFLFTRIAP